LEEEKNNYAQMDIAQADCIFSSNFDSC
jgi:hypothetical protein